MSNLLFADGIDLKLWAERRDAQAGLPRLVRRLISGTVKRVERLQFRADEGVQLRGWDGIVQVAEGNAFVPKGLSAWELSTRKDVKDKAEEDYTTRSADPVGLDRASTFFIFVTARRWNGKEQWAEEKRRDGIWKDVRAYDADDLVAWLEQAPAVHFWFSILIGKHPVGATDLGSHWDAWSGATQPPLSPDLLISGREDAVSKVHQWLRGEPSILGLQADTRDEAVAFFIASLFRISEEERERILTRGVVVEDITAWRQLSLWDNSLILVPMFPDRGQVAQAVKKGHYLLIPLDRSEPATGETLSLPRLRCAEAEKALAAVSFTEGRARDLAVIARRSLGALRRKLAVSPATLIPKWNEPEAARSLLPALLAGRWNDKNDADREAVARLAGREYAEVREIVVRWAHKPDPPVRLIDHTWMVAAREDAWLLLARYLTDDDLERFEAMVLDVLRERDPQFDLPTGERWLANIRGKVLKYSGHLREGMAETLILMAVLSDQCSLGTTTGQLWVERIVKRLFDQVTDWQLWASLSPLLRLLAEAAPQVFLDAVERELSVPNPSLINLFADVEYHFMESSPHTGLLWALEVLGWSPDYLGQAALLLAKLARLDPGGTVANRPIRSLRGIFLSWHPRTTANLERRLRVLDTIRNREPQVAWDLLVKLLPRSHDVAHPTARPKWRDWVPEQRAPITYGELYKATTEIVGRLLEDVGNDGARWHTLIEEIDQLPGTEFDAVIDHLLLLNPEDLAQPDRLKIWKALRDLLSRHLEFPDAEWAIPQTGIDRLRQCYTRFEPEDPLLKRSWLFTRHPNSPEGGYSDWQEREKAIEQARIRAIEELFDLGGVPMVFELAGRAEDPYIVGWTLGKSKALDGQEETLLGKGLGSADSAWRDAALGFLRGRTALKGQEWLEGLRGSGTWQEWTPQQRADYYLCMPFSGRTWDILETEEGETQHLYWSTVGVYGHGDLEAEDYERATRKFIEYNRIATAVKFLALHRKNLHYYPQLVSEVLEHVVRGSNTEEVNWSSLSYDIGELVSFLGASGEIEENRLARFEWYFLPILKHSRHQPKTLHKALAEDPEFFVEVLKWLYRAEGEQPDEPTEEQRIRGQVAFDLLHSWKRPPGVSEEGAVNAEKLWSWINRARELAHASGRAKIADHHIGQVLAHYPGGTDGAWPHEVLRDLLEQLNAVK